MSGIDIDHGGVISVDPDVLREIARRTDVVAGRFDHAHDSLARAYRVIVDAPGFSAEVDTVELWASGERVARLRTECRETATSTLLMADVYEYVELKAEAAMLSQTDPAASRRLILQADRLAQSDERIPDMAAELEAQWQLDRFRGLLPVPFLPLAAGPFFAAAVAAGVRSGLGKVTPGETLKGRADPVTVTPVKTSTPSAAPGSLATALKRMPTATGAQVAVEKYTFPDGRTRFVAYVKGTQSVGVGGAEPWDMKSNIELYQGQRSASYQATIDALEAAGAGPGDVVDVVAHSQAGMVAAHLSMESEFDVQMQITAGSPVEPTLDDDQTLVQIRHTDDPVSELSDGSAEGTGSDDSFTVSREADPGVSLGDFRMDQHSLETYTETAAMADASGDPRVDELDDFWAGLARAETIERTEYHAERVQDHP
ncbi:hypothetical protein [uncultured Microbacterium sp.]|uniref:hypothetical protein n=1 Tax=uncultured Microbacterium sp. TaxID=191216 RepID=UPI0028D86528|nr:hypothetical protein [uncultured Microbacterium sp.]